MFLAKKNFGVRCTLSQANKICPKKVDKQAVKSLFLARKTWACAIQFPSKVVKASLLPRIYRTLTIQHMTNFLQLICRDKLRLAPKFYENL